MGHPAKKRTIRTRKRSAANAKPAKRPVGRPRARTLTELGKWLEQSGLSRTDLAQKLDIERKSVDRLARGVRRPSLELALRIEQVTAGEVPPSSWNKVPPHTKG